MQAKESKDTLGGEIEVVVEGVPVGVGSHTHYDRKLDYALSGAVASVQSVKSVSIGLGEEYADKFGSEVHDQIEKINGKITRKTNNAGGIEGGIKVYRSKYKLENWLFPGTYRINVDGVHKGTNYHYVGGCIGLQGRFALEEVYRDDAGNLIKPTNPSSYEHPKIAEIKERINKTWRAIFDEYDSLDTDYKKIRKLKLSRKFPCLL